MTRRVQGLGAFLFCLFFFSEDFFSLQRGKGGAIINHELNNFPVRRKSEIHARMGITGANAVPSVRYLPIVNPRRCEHSPFIGSSLLSCVASNDSSEDIACRCSSP